MGGSLYLSGEAKRKFDMEEQQIMVYLAFGYKQKEIADEFDKSQQWVSRKVKKIRDHFKLEDRTHYLENDDIVVQDPDQEKTK